MMAKAKFWTEDELERLRRLSRAGHHTRLELAQALGRSQTSTDEKLKMLGLVPKLVERSTVVIGGREWADHYEAPSKIKTDHLTHCLAVLRANDGRGFPVCRVASLVRIAA